MKHAEAWPVGLKDDFASPFETIFAAWWHLRGQQGRRGHEGAELDLFVVLPPKERTCLVLGSTCRAGTTCRGSLSGGVDQHPLVSRTRSLEETGEAVIQAVPRASHMWCFRCNDPEASAGGSGAGCWRSTGYSCGGRCAPCHEKCVTCRSASTDQEKHVAEVEARCLPSPSGAWACSQTHACVHVSVR